MSVTVQEVIVVDPPAQSLDGAGDPGPDAGLLGGMTAGGLGGLHAEMMHSWGATRTTTRAIEDGAAPRPHRWPRGRAFPTMNSLVAAR